jgi:hypothetical protein
VLEKIRSIDVIVSETEMIDWQDEINKLDRYIRYNEYRYEFISNHALYLEIFTMTMYLQAVNMNLLIGRLLHITMYLFEHLLIYLFQFNNTRTESQCRLKWLNELCPRWSQQRQWKNNEMKALTALIQQQNDNVSIDWDKIAEMLNSKRTPFQCFEIYQSQLNDHICKKYVK